MRQVSAPRGFPLMRPPPLRVPPSAPVQQLPVPSHIRSIALRAPCIRRSCANSDTSMTDPMSMPVLFLTASFACLLASGGKGVRSPSSVQLATSFACSSNLLETGAAPYARSCGLPVLPLGGRLQAWKLTLRFAVLDTTWMSRRVCTTTLSPVVRLPNQVCVPSLTGTGTCMLTASPL